MLNTHTAGKRKQVALDSANAPSAARQPRKRQPTKSAASHQQHHQQERAPESSVWIAGLINSNIEQLLSTFATTNAASQAARNQPPGPTSAASFDSFRNRANSTGSCTPLSSFSAASSPASSCTSASALPSPLSPSHSSSSLPSPPSSSGQQHPQSQSQLQPHPQPQQYLQHQHPHQHHAPAQHQMHQPHLHPKPRAQQPPPPGHPLPQRQQQQQSLSLSASISTVTSRASVAAALLPRSPISRQIKFHEYKGPPSSKRQTPAKSQHQNQQKQQQQTSQAEPTKQPLADQPRAPAKQLTQQAARPEGQFVAPSSSACASAPQQQPRQAQPVVVGYTLVAARPMPPITSHHFHQHVAPLRVEPSAQPPQASGHQPQSASHIQPPPQEPHQHPLLTTTSLQSLCYADDSEQNSIERLVGDTEHVEACDIEPTISFGQGIEELLFSEFIDLQNVPMNVDETDWLKKFLPPCSSTPSS